MTSRKISQLDLGTPALPTDLTVTARGSANFRVPITDLLPAMNYTAAASGAVARSVPAKLGDIVSVKDFGAVGDGVTDDTAAIQAAMDYNSGLPKTVYVPPGTYLVGQSLIVIPSNTTFLGSGDSAILKLNPSVAYSAASSIMISVQASKENIKIKNIYFDGNRDNLTSAPGTQSPIIAFYRDSNFSIEGCTFYRVKGISINLGSSLGPVSICYNKFIECGGKVDNSLGYRHQAIAFSAEAGFVCEGVRIANNYFFEQALDCISLADCVNVIIEGNIAERSYTLLYTNALSAGSHVGCFNVSVINNIIRDCSEFGAGTLFPPNGMDFVECRNLVISNNVLQNTDQHAFGIFDNCSKVAVNSNVIVNCVKVTGNAKSAIFSMCPSEFSCSYNTILRTSSLMNYGVVVQTSATNQYVSDNTIIGAVISRVGKVNGNQLQPISAYDGTGVTTSTRVLDVNFSTNVENVYGKVVVHPNWQDFTPNIVAQSGTFTTVLVQVAKYTEINNTVFVQLQFGIVDAGTGTGEIRFTIPVATTAAYLGNGQETFNANQCLVSPQSGSVARMLKYNSTSAIITGGFYRVSMTYPIL